MDRREDQNREDQDNVERRQAGQRRETVEDADTEGRADYFMDIDRMVNEGLGGGIVSDQNGLIGDTTTDTMQEPDAGEL
jgi:hypothetical protein